jgi:hypothetical protein
LGGQQDYPMKKSFIDGVSTERVSALANSPKVVEFVALMNKVSSGSATREERLQFRKRTSRARNLNPRVLVD